MEGSRYYINDEETAGNTGRQKRTNVRKTVNRKQRGSKPIHRHVQATAIQEVHQQYCDTPTRHGTSTVPEHTHTGTNIQFRHGEMSQAWGSSRNMHRNTVKLIVYNNHEKKRS